MSKQIWLTAEAVLAVHGEALSRFGGEEVSCDENLLDLALDPSNKESLSLFEMAAAYAHGVVKNYPFLAGNKRSGFMAAALFLEVNGLRFGASEEEVVSHTRALAAGDIGADEYATWLKGSCK